MINKNSYQYEAQQWRRFALVVLVFLFISFSLVVLFASAGPRSLCERWGGSYYNNGECYIIANMDLCVYPGGEVGEKPATYYNFTGV